MNWAFAIKQYRLTKGLTIEALAEEWGTTAKSVGNWEAGRHEPADWVRDRLKNSVTSVVNITLMEGLGLLVDTCSKHASLVDANMRIVRMSPSLLKSWETAGLTKEAIYGSLLSEYMPQSTIDAFIQHGGIDAAIGSPQIAKTTIRWHRQASTGQKFSMPFDTWSAMESYIMRHNGEFVAILTIGGLISPEEYEKLPQIAVH